MDTSLRTVIEATAQLHITPGAVRDAIVRGRIIPVCLGGRGKRAGMLLIPDAQLALYRERYLGKRGRYHRGKKDAEAILDTTLGGKTL